MFRKIKIKSVRPQIIETVLKNNGNYAVALPRNVLYENDLREV